jgi:hypothetical protein
MGEAMLKVDGKGRWDGKRGFASTFTSECYSWTTAFLTCLIGDIAFQYCPFFPYITYDQVYFNGKQVG